MFSSPRTRQLAKNMLSRYNWISLFIKYTSCLSVCYQRGKVVAMTDRKVSSNRCSDVITWLHLINHAKGKKIIVNFYQNGKFREVDVLFQLFLLLTDKKSRSDKVKNCLWATYKQMLLWVGGPSFSWYFSNIICFQSNDSLTTWVCILLEFICMFKWS